MQAATDRMSTDRRDSFTGLRLSKALSHAVRAMPQMIRGAGPVLIMSLMLGLASSYASGLAAGFAGLMAAICGLAGFGASTRIGLFGLAGARTKGLVMGGFQLKRLEFRLLGAALLISLFMTIILSMLALTALALFGASGLNAEAIKTGDWAQVGPVWKLVLLAVVAAIILTVPILMAVRLSLYAQATAVWGRMTSLGATGVTNGAMLSLFAGLLVCSLPVVLWGSLAITGVVSGFAAQVLGLICFLLLQMPLSSGFLGVAWHGLGDEGTTP